MERDGLNISTEGCLGLLQELNGKVRVTAIFPAKTNSAMTEGRGEQADMIQPEDIAEAALLPFRMSSMACPSEIVVRNACDVGT